jgi:hypothetical protein
MLKTLGTYAAYYIGAFLLTMLVSHFASPSLPSDLKGALQGLVGFGLLWVAHKHAQETVREQQEQTEQTA